MHVDTLYMCTCMYLFFFFFFFAYLPLLYLAGVFFHRFGVSSPDMDKEKMREVSLQVGSDIKACTYTFTTYMYIASVAWQ